MEDIFSSFIISNDETASEFGQLTVTFYVTEYGYLIFRVKEND